MTPTKFACFYFENGADTKAIAQKSFQFSSQIYFLNQSAVIVEFGKSRLLFSEAAFVGHASQMLKEHCETFRIAVADNHLFAYIKAKYGVANLLSAPLAALEDILDPLAVGHKEAIETRKVIAKLSRLQIRTLNDFKNLPREHFPSRFGETGLLLKSRIDGKFLPAFAQAKPGFQITARKELSSSYNGALAELISVIEELLKVNIFPPLRALGAKVEELKISFVLEKNSRHPDERRSFEVKFVEPQFRADDTIRIIWTCIETSLQKNPIHFSTPVLFIEVEAVKWCLDLDEQVDMLNKERLREEKENILLTRQKIRYGDENIFRVELTQDRRPEKSWKKVLDPKVKPVKLDIKGKVPTRPIYRLPSPHPVHISTDRSRITRGARSEKITQWEPMSEILASHWFENEKGVVLNTFNRVYSRVHLANGRELSIFQDHEGRFFLDGFSG